MKIGGKILWNCKKYDFSKAKFAQASILGGIFFMNRSPSLSSFALSERILPQSGELATYLLRGLLCATIDRRRSHPNNNKMCITVKFYYKTAN